MRFWWQDQMKVYCFLCYLVYAFLSVWLFEIRLSLSICFYQYGSVKLWSRLGKVIDPLFPDCSLFPFQRLRGFSFEKKNTLTELIRQSTNLIFNNNRGIAIPRNRISAEPGEWRLLRLAFTARNDEEINPFFVLLLARVWSHLYRRGRKPAKVRWS